MDKGSAPLLKTKLYLPPPRPNLVPRPRLAAQMDAALRPPQRLVLISARAGAGKTTLVVHWLEGLRLQMEDALPQPSNLLSSHLPIGIAWISLDEQDNDPQRFFSYLVGALRGLDIPVRQAGPGEGETGELLPAEAAVAGLINDLAARPVPLILVLDDYHVIRNDWIHQAVGYLVEHQPPEMHLVLTTRVDPPLPLARWRARGLLAEIRDGDLRFSPAETAELLNTVLGLDLPAEAVAAIEQRTEGWVTGLQLAAISARGRQQEGSLGPFIAAFGGTNRYILDYLVEEVLSQQPPAVQDFLIETSILEQMCAELCDAVLESRESRAGSSYNSRFSTLDSLPPAQGILEYLERANLFVVPLDPSRTWYRYHPLFADLLQSLLRQRRSPDEIGELHRRAGRWYQAEGYLGEALNHLLAAKDFERAADLLDENILGLAHFFSRSNAPLILGWIEKLPEEIRRSRPWIELYRANMLALNLDLEGVEPILVEVEKRVEPGAPRAAQLLGHIAAIRSYLANLRGDPAQVRAMAALVKETLPGEEYLAAQSTVALALADTCFAGDDLPGARQAYTELLRIGEKTGQLLLIVLALCELATIKQVEGQLHQAQALYTDAYRWLERRGLDSRVRCSYEFGLADLLREWNQLDAALEHARRGLEYRQRLGGYKLLGDLALMRVLQARGDVEGAMQALQVAEQAAQELPFQLALMIEFRTGRVSQWLAAGDVETASRWAGELRGGSEPEQITLARLRLAQGRAADALDLLSRQRPQAEAGGRTGRLIEILALQSVALEALGRGGEALAALRQALALARPQGFRRAFLDLGRPLQALLERLAGSRPDVGGEARALLDAFRQEPGAPAIPQPPALAETLLDPLSGRELEVLRLLAEGLSNKEIASRLFVAPGTIKQHLKNICRKLEVHGRMQAVRRGQELGLL